LVLHSALPHRKWHHVHRGIPKTILGIKKQPILLRRGRCLSNALTNTACEESGPSRQGLLRSRSNYALPQRCARSGNKFYAGRVLTPFRFDALSPSFVAVPERIPSGERLRRHRRADVGCVESQLDLSHSSRFSPLLGCFSKCVSIWLMKSRHRPSIRCDQIHRGAHPPASHPRTECIIFLQDNLYLRFNAARSSPYPSQFSSIIFLSPVEQEVQDDDATVRSIPCHNRGSRSMCPARNSVLRFQPRPPDPLRIPGEVVNPVVGAVSKDVRTAATPGAHRVAASVGTPMKFERCPTNISPQRVSCIAGLSVAVNGASVLKHNRASHRRRGLPFNPETSTYRNVKGCNSVAIRGRLSPPPLKDKWSVPWRAAGPTKAYRLDSVFSEP